MRKLKLADQPQNFLHVERAAPSPDCQHIALSPQVPLSAAIFAFSAGIVGNRTDAEKISSHTRILARRAMQDKGPPPDRHDWYARATEALQRARQMKPGAKRSEALKKAGQLQTAADIRGYLKSKELRPPK
jgi:hypothetical protein